MADLLSVETPRVRVSWTGPSVAATEGVRVHAFRGSARLGSAVGEERAEPDATVPLAIPEESHLSLLVQSLSEAPVEMAHRDPSQVAGLTSTAGGRVVHGRVLVRDAAGWSRFTVQVGGRPEVEVVWPVVPVKLAPESVRMMREDVEAAWTGAALAAWSRTTQGALPAGGRSNPAWLALLREAVRRLGPALDAMAKRQEVDLVREPQLVPAFRLRGDAASVAAIRKGKGRGEWVDVVGAATREHVVAHVLRPTENTASHRWIRGRIDQAGHRVAKMLREESEHAYAGGGARRALRADLARLGEKMERFARVGPLAEVTGTRTPMQTPLVLRRRPAYRQVFDALRLLDEGLAVVEGEVEAAWMSTARLYETWAALAVVQEAARVIGAEPPDSPFGLEVQGARLRVRRGHRASVRVRGPRGEIEVAYEPRFGGPPALLAQRPDFVLTLRRPGEAPRLAVLDAKYRRDDSPAYVRRHGAPGPPEDALGDLHRYRDAIVDRGGGRLIERAAALFPSRLEADSVSSRWWRSHETVGIGAVPLTPGDRSWLEAWLWDWVCAS